MKILLTGSTGMVGRNILDRNESRYEFITPSHSELDLLNSDDTRNFLMDIRPEMVIHTAGLVGGILANISGQARFMCENFDMGRNVVLAARDAGVKKLLNLGSSCMYPRDAENPLKESVLGRGELEPTNEGYAIAKIAVAKLCAFVSENQDFKYKTVIPCNLYGKWDKFAEGIAHMVPSAIRKIHRACVNGDMTVSIWGDGTARREFMYAGDLADMILYSIEHFDNLPQYINAGLGEDYTITEYYKMIAELIGYKGSFTYDLSKPAGMKQKLVDVKKLREFGWKHKVSLTEGLEKTIDYYLSHCQ